MAKPKLRATTILSVRRGDVAAIGGDGQVSRGDTMLKGDAKKIRALAGGRVLCGFAGATADAFTLLERLEGKLELYPDQLTRAAVELAKDWRTDRALRRLEAMLIVADSRVTLTVTGAGDVIEPEHDVAAIGSGGDFARAAARALLSETDLPPDEIVEKSLRIAASICVYTNDQIMVKRLGEEARQ